MRSGPATILLVALLLAPTLAARAQDDPPPLAHMPGIAVGDFWDFRVTGSAEGYVQNRIAEREPHQERGGGPVDSFRVHAVSEVVATQKRGAFEAKVEERLEVDKWVRTADEATIGIEGTVTIRQSGSDASTNEVQRYYTPPLVEHIYPFGVGSAWEVKVQVWTKQGGDDPRTEDSAFHAEVVAYEEITVPAGTFMAYKMDISFEFEGGRMVRWYSDAACTTVREERYGVSAAVKEPEAVYVLTDHKCSHTASQDPKYDPRFVTLHAAPRHIPSGSDTPAFEDPADPKDEGVGSGVWLALAVIVGVSIALIGYGRKRR